MDGVKCIMYCEQLHTIDLKQFNFELSKLVFKRYSIFLSLENEGKETLR